MTTVAGREVPKPMAWISSRGRGGGAAWRSQVPKLAPEKCTGCLVCWKFCPEPAIAPVDGKVAFDMGTCKGCGICMEECPFGAITMQAEVV